MNKKIFALTLIIFMFFATTQVFAGAVTIPNPLSGVNNFKDLLCRIAQAIGAIVGILGTIAIVVSGILYLTSAGNPEKMNKARVAFFAGLIGIFIGVAAVAIVEIALEIIGAPTASC